VAGRIGEHVLLRDHGLRFFFADWLAREVKSLHRGRGLFARLVNILTI